MHNFATRLLYVGQRSCRPYNGNVDRACCFNHSYGQAALENRDLNKIASHKHCLQLELNFFLKLCKQRSIMPCDKHHFTLNMSTDEIQQM